jgi:hypothetical protein
MQTSDNGPLPQEMIAQTPNKSSSAACMGGGVALVNLVQWGRWGYQPVRLLDAPGGCGCVVKPHTTDDWNPPRGRSTIGH